MTAADISWKPFTKNVTAKRPLGRISSRTISPFRPETHCGGLHFQIRCPQAKLVQVISGEIFDVAVDLRPGSPTFGDWAGVCLSEKNHRQLFIPEGFAHGFCVLSDTARFLYKCSAFYDPADEGGILWSDPDIGIDWPITDPLLSEKDAAFPRLANIPPDRLPGKAGAA